MGINNDRTVHLPALICVPIITVTQPSTMSTTENGIQKVTKQYRNDKVILTVLKYEEAQMIEQKKAVEAQLQIAQGEVKQVQARLEMALLKMKCVRYQLAHQDRYANDLTTEDVDILNQTLDEN